MTIALAIIGLLTALVPVVVWWVTNRLPTKPEVKRDRIDQARQQLDKEIDEWLKKNR